jgi:hypothetical protein
MVHRFKAFVTKIISPEKCSTPVYKLPLQKIYKFFTPVIYLQV